MASLGPHWNGESFLFHATKRAVDSTVAMATWFARGFSMTVGARKMVHTLLRERARLAVIPPPDFEIAARMLNSDIATRLDPAHTLQAL